jgi:hypothetical protein
MQCHFERSEESLLSGVEILRGVYLERSRKAHIVPISPFGPGARRGETAFGRESRLGAKGELSDHKSNIEELESLTRAEMMELKAHVLRGMSRPRFQVVVRRIQVRENA